MHSFIVRWEPVFLLLLAMACGSDDDMAPGGGGTLELATTTTGTQPDNDGYTIMVDASPHGTIGPNDHVSVTDVGAGDHTVELAQIQFNCATLGSFSRPVTLSASAGASVDYDVQCDAESRSRIAYAWPSDSSDGEILLVNADGSDPVSLTDLVGAVRVRGGQNPAGWSGDGGMVAFTGADSALYAANADGTGVVQLAPAGFSPTWTRDGQKVAFLVHEEIPGGNPCCKASNLFVVSPGGGSPVRITDLTDLNFFDFAASGGTIAYEQGVTSRVFTVRDDGTSLTPIAPADICCLQRPSLSPDGTRVAYFAYPSDQSGEPGYEIYVSSTDGSGPAVDVSHNPGDDWSPAWTPDGTRIAFVNSAPGFFFGPGSLHVVNADGTGQNNVTPTDVVTEPSWSPDGTRIAYTGYVSGNPHVYVANADGSGRVDITPSRPAARPTWTGR